MPAEGPDAIARRFLARWGQSYEELIASFQDTLAERGVWDQRPMARTRTRGQAVAFLRCSRVLLRLDRIQVQVHALAVSGNVVHTQRTDVLLTRSGTVLAAPAVAGVMTFDEHGRIVDWREYFDASSLAGALLGRLVARVGRQTLTLARGQR